MCSCVIMHSYKGGEHNERIQDSNTVKGCVVCGVIAQQLAVMSDSNMQRASHTLYTSIMHGKDSMYTECLQ